jgi:hypothetical protein
MARTDIQLDAMLRHLGAAYHPYKEIARLLTEHRVGVVSEADLLSAENDVDDRLG